MNKALTSTAHIAHSIYLLRGQKVLLDFDLPRLYGVTTGNLNKAVKRNSSGFPGDFMFRLRAAEWESLIFQLGISKPRREIGFHVRETAPRYGTRKRR